MSGSAGNAWWPASAAHSDHPRHADRYCARVFAARLSRSAASTRARSAALNSTGRVVASGAAALTLAAVWLGIITYNSIYRLRQGQVSSVVDHAENLPVDARLMPWYAARGGCQVNTTTDPVPVSKRRRSIGGEALTHSVSVALPVSLWTRLDALSAAHGVARGTIAREAIDAGLRAVTERLRRATRRDAREAGK